MAAQGIDGIGGIYNNAATANNLCGLGYETLLGVVWVNRKILTHTAL
jgi:hypothetical protein